MPVCQECSYSQYADEMTSYENLFHFVWFYISQKYAAATCQCDVSSASFLRTRWQLKNSSRGANTNPALNWMMGAICEWTVNLPPHMASPDDDSHNDVRLPLASRVERKASKTVKLKTLGVTWPQCFQEGQSFIQEWESLVHRILASHLAPLVKGEIVLYVSQDQIRSIIFSQKSESLKWNKLEGKRKQMEQRRDTLTRNLQPGTSVLAREQS